MKKFLSLLLALTLCLGLLPAAALAVETEPPDWYFLFAIFKNVDADYTQNGTKKHTTYSMTQDEINFIREDAQDFEAYMTQTGVMRAHVDVVEIDTPITQLQLVSSDSSDVWLSPELAYPLLNDKVDLNQYDHVTCAASLNISTSYLGLGGLSYENDTGHSYINLENREYCLNVLRLTEKNFPPSMYVHEFLHFMERMSRRWGTEFGLHDIRINFYSPDHDNGKRCYTDIILNRARGNAGTGVHPAAWQYPPRILRTISELRIPSNVASIGDRAFWGRTALTGVSIPTSVASIGYAAFWDTGVKDVYYSGTEAQWRAIQMGEFNGALTKASIHCNSLMADVKTNDWFAQPVAWAMEKGIAAGTGNGSFSPNAACTQAQILSFLWRANGSPTPVGTAGSGEYYAAALQWAEEQGIIGENLPPDSPCTRSDVVTYLWKLAGSPDAGTADFTDVPAGADYAKAVNWALENGVTAGVSETRFGPDSICTRGQIVTFLYSALAK